MTELEWWSAAAVIFKEEREYLDILLDTAEASMELRREVMGAIRRTLARLERLDKPLIQ